MKKLLKYKPKIYKNSKIVDDIYFAQQEQLEKIEDNRKKLKNNLSIFRAEDIREWLKEYDVKNTGNKTQDRVEVISKVLGNEVCDKRLLTNLVSKFVSGNIKIMEDVDNNLVNILIVSESEKLKNENELTKILYRILPAHIDFTYIYSRPVIGSIKICGIAQSTEVIRV